MVSFRHDQFQAMLLGLVIADAVSHGQLPPSFDRRLPGVTPAAPRAWRTALPSDRWCHQLGADLQTLGKGGDRPRDGECAQPTTPADLLAQLPQVWLIADGDRAAVEALPESLGAAWQVSLWAALNQDQDLMTALHPVLAHRPVPLAQTLGLALEQVSQAAGNFDLAVGQSLYSAPHHQGLPLLTGVLSAAWVGVAGLPLSDCQRLKQPDASLQAWLQQRWQITSTTTVMTWAQGLWQRWLGCLPPPVPAGSDHLAVQGAGHNR